MSDRFTETIDPLALASKGRSIEGEIALVELHRVLPLLRSDAGEVRFSLIFNTDEAGIPRIQGKVQATLCLQCQRCMEDMDFTVASKVRLGIVTSRAEAEQLPDNYEPLVCNEETTIVSILEDELILALPIVAMHKIEDCPMGDRVSTQEDRDIEKNDVTAGRKNPFAVLARLKTTEPEDTTETE